MTAFLKKACRRQAPGKLPVHAWCCPVRGVFMPPPKGDERVDDADGTGIGRPCC